MVFSYYYTGEMEHTDTHILIIHTYMHTRVRAQIYNEINWLFKSIIKFSITGI